MADDFHFTKAVKESTLDSMDPHDAVGRSHLKKCILLPVLTDRLNMKSEKCILLKPRIL